MDLVTHSEPLLGVVLQPQQQGAEGEPGQVEPPAAPGLGIELVEETLRRYPYGSGAGSPFLLR